MTGLTKLNSLDVVRVIGQSGIPFIMVGSGLMVANGVGTLTTALAATPAITNAYCYFALNAISSGVPAGWYYTVFTTTTAFTVFNNTYTSGTPTIPASPTAFSTASPVSYTGSSSAITAYSLSVPGNTLGPNGGLRIAAAWSYTNTAANKTFSVAFGSMSLANGTATTTAAAAAVFGIKNAGATNIQNSTQTGSVTAPYGTTTNSIFSGTVDTTVAQSVTITLTNATPATNNLALMNATVELLPGVP